MAQTVSTASLTKLHHMYKLEELPSCPTRKTHKNPLKTNTHTHIPAPQKPHITTTTKKPQSQTKRKIQEKYLGINNSNQLRIVDII